MFAPITRQTRAGAKTLPPRRNRSTFFFGRKKPRNRNRRGINRRASGSERRHGDTNPRPPKRAATFPGDSCVAAQFAGTESAITQSPLTLLHDCSKLHRFNKKHRLSPDRAAVNCAIVNRLLGPGVENDAWR